jgi:hypothetical protein
VNRKGIRTFLVTVAIIAELFVASPVGATWSPTTGAGEAGIVLSDSNAFQQQGSILLGGLGTSNGVINETICPTYASDGPCAFGSPGVNASATIKLAVCTLATQTNCVASLSTGTSATPPAPCSFVRMVDGNNVTADPRNGLPEGSTDGVWQCSTPDAAGSTDYATSVAVGYFGVDASTGDFIPESFVAAVQPFAQVSGDYATPVPSSYTSPQGFTGVAYDQLADPGCAFQESAGCGLTQDFQSGTVVTMSVRLTNQIGGWFMGRLADPALAVAAFDSTSNLLTVTGQSVTVPELEATTPIPDSSPSIAEQDCFAPNGGVPLGSDFYLNQSNVGNSFAIVDGCRALVNNTASGVSTEWSITSEGDQGNACLTNTSKILGLVTTNSMAYQGSAPTFSNGVFTYGVAGMHYVPGGSLALGSYGMILSDSVARCLYGFTSAPISASVSITENDGSENVATTSVADSGGWLNLSVDGFTFSDPVIKVKLTQKLTRKIARAKISSIQCEKGKIMKDVRGIDPKCPAGFVKRKS